jgi:hypothetical protein
VAAHRSDEDRWAKAQHDMPGSSRGQRPHDRYSSSWALLPAMFGYDEVGVLTLKAGVMN